MTVKDFLSMYKNTETEIDEMSERMERLRSKAEKCTPEYGGAVGVSPNANVDKIPRLVEMIIEEEQRTSKRIDEISEIRKDIELSIYSVQNNTLRTLLIMRYIGGKTWEQIAVMMNYSFVHIVHRLHPTALECVKIPEKYEKM